MARQGVVEGVKGVKSAPTPLGIYKNGTKNGRFPELIDLKITKYVIFYSKVLIAIYFQDVF
jgi:hypothetical protein